MKTFDRGSTVRITTNFYDADGNLLNPPAATVTLRYHNLGTRQSVTYSMALSGTSWLYDWDSTVADAGVVEGHAQSAGASQIASKDFELRLVANGANRDQNTTAF